MSATAGVQAAQAALNAAKQREQEERRVRLTRELEQVTNHLQAQQNEYQGLRERVLLLRARRSGLQNALSELLGQEAEHAANKPRIADHLPSAPAAIAWNKASARLAVQRAAISRELAETSIVAQMDVDLAKLGTEIQRLEFAQHNLIAALDDQPKPFLSPISEPPRGGLSRVAWK